MHMFRTAATPVQSEKTSVQTHSKESSGVSYMRFDLIQRKRVAMRNKSDVSVLFCFYFYPK